MKYTLPHERKRQQRVAVLKEYAYNTVFYFGTIIIGVYLLLGLLGE
jgi:hypothetical protein